MFDNIYKNKRVLITGHTGFKGSWLAIWLKELGADVIGYALDPPSEPNNFDATKLGEKVTHIHGDIRNPHAIRPWQHVLEPLGGYLQLGAALWQDPQEYSGSWNFGPEDSSHLTVAEMAKRLIKHWGEGKWDDLSDPQALHEASLLKLNCDKAHAELNWHSVLTIDECLQMTADWYKGFYSGIKTKDMHQFCLVQIRKYEGKAAKRGQPCWR